MGYSNYWQIAEDTEDTIQEEAQRILTAVLTMAETMGVIKADDYDEEPYPLVSSEMIFFNGNPNHETFAYTQAEKRWNACKTARKPYDIYVKACLVVMSHFSDVAISCDGGESDFIPALHLVGSLLGEAPDIKWME